MQLAVSATPAYPSNVVARMVRDDMPGMGIEWIAKGDQLAVGTKFASVEDAVNAAAELTAPDDAPAAGVFQAGTAYELYSLLETPEGGAYKGDKYFANDSDYTARTTNGRNLVKIVDGGAEIEPMSAKAFRAYERYATTGD